MTSSTPSPEPTREYPLIQMLKYRYEVRLRSGRTLAQFESHRNIGLMDLIWWQRIPYRVYSYFESEGLSTGKTPHRILYVDQSGGEAKSYQAVQRKTP